jgi:hypothetical protein
MEMMSSILLLVAGFLAVLVFLSWTLSLLAGRERREARAIMLGLLWSSSAPAAVLGIAFPLGRGIEGILATFVMCWFFSSTVTLFVGLPTFLVLRRLLAPGTWWISAAVGWAIGLLADWAVSGRHGSSEFGVVSGFSGVIAALGFWLIWTVGSSPHQPGRTEVAAGKDHIEGSCRAAIRCVIARFGSATSPQA